LQYGTPSQYFQERGGWKPAEMVRRHADPAAARMAWHAAVIAALLHDTRTAKEGSGATIEKGPHLAMWPLNSGSPTWTRTRDLRINSPSLYQLSYQGKEATLYVFEAGLSNFRPWRHLQNIVLLPFRINFR
jgi:hypothetical protein